MSFDPRHPPHVVPWDTVDLSEAHLVHGAEQRFGDCTEGLPVQAAFQYLLQEGVVSERAWPYDEMQTCWAHPPDIDGERKMRFSSISVLADRDRAAVMAAIRDRVNGDFVVPQRAPEITRAIKSALAAGVGPSGRPAAVAAAVPVWFRSSGHLSAGWEPDSGRVDMPRWVDVAAWLNVAQARGLENGWHVVAICGWDDVDQTFEFKNSWGAGWSRDGFGTISFDYIESFASTIIAGDPAPQYPLGEVL